jgi:hypothetical protein
MCLIAVGDGMRDFGEFEPSSADDRSRDEKALGKYMVCVGGYPREALSTFAEAEARAWDLLRFEPRGDFSIYEVETGIHFDVAEIPRLEEGVMPGVFDGFFGVHQMR